MNFSYLCIVNQKKGSKGPGEGKFTSRPAKKLFPAQRAKTPLEIGKSE